MRKLFYKKTKFGMLSHTRATLLCVLLSLVATHSNGQIINAFGSNSSGQLGIGNTTQQNSPVQVGTATNWQHVSTGYYHSLAIKSDGTLWAWGSGLYGLLGTGNTTNQSSPVQVGTATNWQHVSTGYYHSLAIKSDGTLWAWGSGTDGQLGTGNTTQQNSPMQVGTATNWQHVSTGYYHSLAIKSDGTLWAWGNGYLGQLGTGNTTNQLSPVQIGTATNWQNISVGYDHSLAIKSDGTLWAWGNGYFGQLGTGNTTNQLSPVQIGTATNWQHVSPGDYHTLAIKSDGTLWAWGKGENGQLGTGNTTNQLSPVQIGTATNWQYISAGRNHSLAIKSDGTLWAWGNGENGQLGTGNTTNQLSPVQIGTATNWQYISAGMAHSLVLSSVPSACPPGDVTLNTQAQVDQFIIDYPNCTEINGHLGIGNQVQNLNGLSNITSIIGSISAEYASSLSDISGLSNLTSVGQDIFIRNTALTNLNGFNNLTSVAGWIAIENNVALTNLNALSTLTSVGKDIYIVNNIVLSDISALQNTTFNPANDYGLTILNNPALAVCNLPNFCAYLANPASTHPRVISGNLAACVNEQAVIDACNVPAAGCTNVTSTYSKWPTATYVPQCTGSQENITGNYAETGEYSEIQVTAAVGYTFSSSVATDYITISNEDGTVVYAHGNSPLAWTAPTNEIVRFFLHLDADCNTNNDPGNWRSRLIECNSLSVSDINTKTISFYPNPVKETLYFSEEVSTIKITDLAGRTVKQYAVKSTSVNVSELSKGTYILSATTQEGKTFTKKIIKE